MAIIKLGALVSGIRGTVGGVTYSANKSGVYAKTWGKGSAVRTESQQTARGLFVDLARAWGLLTLTQRGDWDDLATADPEPAYNSLGELIPQSGYAYFCKCNGRLLWMGLALRSDAPTGGDALRPTSAAILTAQAISHPSGAYYVTWNTAGRIATEFAVIGSWLRPSVGGSYIPLRPRLLGSAAGNAGTVDVSAGWSRAWGTGSPGWIVTTYLWVQGPAGLRSVVSTKQNTVEAPL